MSTDQDVRLRAVLGDLMGKSVSLADAATQVRAMHFPVPPDKTISRQMAESYENEVPEPDKPGSFRMVARALVAGSITMHEYEVLATAAAESIKEQQGKAQHGEAHQEVPGSGQAGPVPAAGGQL